MLLVVMVICKTKTGICEEETMLKMNFGEALKALKSGLLVQRSGWNGIDMYLYLVQRSEFEVNRQPLLNIMGRGTVVKYRAHIDMKTADGSCVPWLASQSDLLDEDWMLYQPPEQQ